MSLGQVARLEEKVSKQREKVNKEQERLNLYQEQLEEAMFATFIHHQVGSQLSFDKALERAFGIPHKTSSPNLHEERHINEHTN